LYRFPALQQKKYPGSPELMAGLAEKLKDNPFQDLLGLVTNSYARFAGMKTDQFTLSP